MKPVEIFFFFFILCLAITGWVFFIVFYSYWQNPRLTPEDNRGWLRATLGLYFGIAFTVILLIYTFVIGSREYHRKHVLEFQKKMNVMNTSPQYILQQTPNFYQQQQPPPNVQSPFLLQYMR